MCTLLTQTHAICPPIRFHPDLKLSESQVVMLKAMHYPTALRDCIQAIVAAAGHSSVTSTLSRLSLYLLIDKVALPQSPTQSCRDTLQSLSWHAAITRYILCTIYFNSKWMNEFVHWLIVIIRQLYCTIKAQSINISNSSWNKYSGDGNGGFLSTGFSRCGQPA